jgi:ABC-type multidrug transport system fused ATPase/permease subunit
MSSIFKVVSKIFLEYQTENPIYILFNIIFVIVSVVNNFYLPSVYGNFYDMFAKDTTKFIKYFITILLAKGVVYLLFQFEDFFYNLQKIEVEEKTQRYVISKIKEKFIIQPEEVIIGEKLASTIKIQKIIKGWYNKIFQSLVPYIFVLVLTPIYMAKIDIYMPFLIILLVIGSYYSIFTNTTRCSDICYDSNKSYITLYQEIEDYLSNLLTIQSYNQFEKEDRNISKHNISFQESNKNIARCSLSGHLIGVFLTISFLFATMYRSYQLLKNGTLNKSRFMSLYFIIASMLGSLIYLSDVFQDFAIEYNNLLDIEKINKLNLFEEVYVPKAIITYPKIKTDSLIKIVDLEYRYPGSDTSIINGFNMEIKKGERIALVGDIGAGKSTLLKIILGLIHPRSGDLFLNGKNYKTLKQTGIFGKFGYMTQTPILFNRSIIDNILFSNPNSSRKQVEELLQEFGLDKVFNKLDKGIDTMVGKNGSKLSGGQKQVVWFLRIYLHDPEILLFDEPTASLSTKSKETLMKLINKGFAKKTIIMASHDDFLIKMATRKVRM